ncbi:MAG TPA: Asp-tRNA(Asn)/Glu-tRNA(Gln) amidotransferase subunit GatC [Verrucomicrobiae bacterium]|nr:Asp-tRNA(Asn)/Glu-tRNA(Gln) amidotransferase subunit GatC [Verrucomicrobiae bacterium]
MSELSRSDIQHLSRLARLSLTEEEYERYATQLTQVVGYVDQLSSVDTSHVESRVGVTGLTNVMRADVPVESDFNLDLALSAAPRRDGDYIEVRAVLGGETESA